MKTKIYVAGGYADRDRVKRVMGWIDNALDMAITRDWVTEIDNIPVPDWKLPANERRAHAMGDLKGVREASVFWLLVPPSGHGKGSWTELGYALSFSMEMLDLHIVCSAQRIGDASIFCDVGDVVLCGENADAEAFREIQNRWVSK